MKISELKIGEKADIEGTIKEIGEVRKFRKFGKQLRVATAIIEDDTGSVKLSLWNLMLTKLELVIKYA